MRRILFILMFLFFSMNASADTVILRSGQKISGNIVERNADSLKVEFEGVALTYYMDEIQSINGRMVDPSRGEPPVRATQPQASPPEDRPVMRNQRGDLFREVPPDGGGFAAPEGDGEPVSPPDDFEPVIPPAKTAAEPVAQPEMMATEAAESELAFPEAESDSVGTAQADSSGKEDFADFYARMQDNDGGTGKPKTDLNPAIKSIVRMIPFGLFGLTILLIIADWIVYDKAGQPGWAVIVPFFNLYVFVKVAQRPGWWFILFFLPVVSIIVVVVLNIDIARHFGKGVGFGLGLTLLPFIFLPILAFGGATYHMPLPVNQVEPLQAPKLNLPES